MIKIKGKWRIFFFALMSCCYLIIASCTSTSSPSFFSLSSSSRDKNSDAKNDKLTRGQEKSRKIFVGILNQDNQFHSWTKDLFLSEDYFSSCLLSLSDASIERIFSWHRSKRKLFLENRFFLQSANSKRSFQLLQKSSDQKVDCLSEKLKWWFDQLPLSTEQKGIVYFIESHLDPQEKWVKEKGAQYFWQLKYQKNIRIMQ